MRRCSAAACWSAWDLGSIQNYWRGASWRTSVSIFDRRLHAESHPLCFLLSFLLIHSFCVKLLVCMRHRLSLKICKVYFLWLDRIEADLLGFANFGVEHQALDEQAASWIRLRSGQWPHPRLDCHICVRKFTLLIISRRRLTEIGICSSFVAAAVVARRSGVSG